LKPEIMAKFADYLLGKGPFPAETSLNICVTSDAQPQRVIISPLKAQETPFVRYEAHIPGMMFELRADRTIASPIEKPRLKKHRRVDFEEVQKQRAEVGRVAEEYALKWEKERLRGLDLNTALKGLTIGGTDPDTAMTFFPIAPIMSTATLK
jgi:hypothetical protein